MNKVRNSNVRSVLTAFACTLVAASPCFGQVKPAEGFAKTTQSKPYLEPYIDRPEQEKAATDKLAALEKKFGRKPNIVILLVDDMGFGDPGCFGGGLLIGAPTPNIDKLATGGLKLLSTYSQPTCTPHTCRTHHRPHPHPKRAHPAHTQRRSTESQSLGRRGHHRKTPVRRGLPHRTFGEVAPRRRQGEPTSRMRIRRVLRYSFRDQRFQSAGG